MKRILVPTDFSPNADKALNYALQIAKRSVAEVILIHAVESYQSEDTIERAKARLEQVQNSIWESEKFRIRTDVFGDSTIPSILDAVKQYGIDLVVMGTVGSSGLREVLYGSRTAGLIGRCPVPVLAIPLLGEWKLPQKILLAVNEFHAEVRQAIQPVIRMADLFGASLQVTIFTDTNDDYVEDYLKHEDRIESFRDLLKAEYPKLEIHAVHLSGTIFRDNLQHWIDNNQIDIVAMLTHRRSILQSLFTSSMTRKMSYHTNIPLLAAPL